MEPKPVGKKVYTSEQMTRAFEYYATSRSLYGKLRKDYKLPSEKAHIFPIISYVIRKKSRVVASRQLP